MPFVRNYYNALANLTTGWFNFATSGDLKDPSAFYGEGSTLMMAYTSTSKAIRGVTTISVVGRLGGSNDYGPFNVFTASFTSAGILVETIMIPEDFDSYDNVSSRDSGLAAQSPLVLSAQYDTAEKTYTSVVRRDFVNTTQEGVTVYSSTCNTGAIPGKYYLPDSTSTSNVPLEYLMERTNFPVPIVVQPGRTLEVTYTLSYKFPEPGVPLDVQSSVTTEVT